MIHFLIDLDDTVKTLLLYDDTIIELREFNYTVDVLDRLYVQLSKYKVDKLSIISHGMLSSCLYEGGCVAYSVTVNDEMLLCSVNEDDMQMIKILTDRCGITDVKFYDKLGYYLALGHKGVCYIDKHNGMQTLMAIDNSKLVKVSMCTENSLADKTESFCTNNLLQTVCAGDELTDEDNLMFFANATMILEDKVTVHDLSVFAYACLELCPDFSYDFGILERTTDRILGSQKEVAVQEDILQIDDLESNIIAEMEKPNKKFKGLMKPKKTVDKPVKTPKSDKTGAPVQQDKKATIAVLIGVICLCLTIGIVVEDFYLKRKLTNTNDEITNVQAVINSTKSTISAYEYCLNMDGNPAFGLFNSVADAISSNDGAVSTIDYRNGVSMIVVQFDTEDAASAFKDSISIPNASVDIVDATENEVSKFTVTIQLNE